MAKTLILEKRGCDFFKNDSINELSDVGNYRVGVYSHSIKGKDGIMYIVEFGGFDKYTYRNTNKRNGQPLKKSVRELVMRNALHIDTEFEKVEESGFKTSWRNSKLEHEVYEMNLPYTKEGILKAINYISADTYTDIEFTR